MRKNLFFHLKVSTRWRKFQRYRDEILHPFSDTVYPSSITSTHQQLLTLVGVIFVIGIMKFKTFLDIIAIYIKKASMFPSFCFVDCITKIIEKLARCLFNEFDRKSKLPLKSKLLLRKDALINVTHRVYRRLRISHLDYFIVLYLLPPRRATFAISSQGEGLKQRIRKEMLDRSKSLSFIFFFFSAYFKLYRRLEGLFECHEGKKNTSKQ